MMESLRRKLTDRIVSLADAGLAVLETRGAKINGRSAAELRELIARRRAQQLGQPEVGDPSDPSKRK